MPGGGIWRVRPRRDILQDAASPTPRRGSWPTGRGVPRMLGGIWGCILSELKEYTPRPPKKNSGGVSIPPPDPSYDPRKGCGPSVGNHPGVTGELRGTGDGSGTPYLGHGLRQPNSGAEFGASVRSSCPTGDEGVDGLVVLARGIGRLGPCGDHKKELP